MKIKRFLKEINKKQLISQENSRRQPTQRAKGGRGGGGQARPLAPQLFGSERMWMNKLGAKVKGGVGGSWPLWPNA